MNKWNTIIFDMDGTLFDTEQISKKAWFEYGEKKHLPVTEEFFLQLIGRNRLGARPIFEAYMPESFDEEEAYQFVHEWMKEYKRIHGPLPKTNLHQLFQALKDKGYQLALCSSSSKQAIESNLNAVGVLDEFKCCVNGSMTENGKPAPDIYLLTAKLMGVKPSECLVIEDSRNGVLSAHNANMDVIMVVDMIEPDDELRNACLKVYHHLDEIIEIL